MNGSALGFALAVILCVCASSTHGQSLGSAFTYQGRLMEQGEPANGLYTMTFHVYANAEPPPPPMGESPLGVAVLSDVEVIDGLFTVQLPFDQQIFSGQRRWLGVYVGVTALLPRQEIRPTPYALALPFLRTLPMPVAPNVIAGHPSNEVLNLRIGATISGGGIASGPNIVDGNHGTIGGGTGNLTNFYGTVSGGLNNQGLGDYAVIGGGSTNVALGDLSTISGGHLNRAEGHFSAIPGGKDNRATGRASFAAGENARALHDSSFVFATGPELASTAPRQFLISTDGVGINTNTPFRELDVNGRINVRQGAIVKQNSFSALPTTADLGLYSATPGWMRFVTNNGPFMFFSNFGSGGIESPDPLAAVMIIGANGNLGVKHAIPTHPITVSNGAFCSDGGVWVNASSRELKENFQCVNGAEMLERLASLPILQWNYTAEGADVRHVGPVAEDFAAIFNLGTDDRSIATVDANGVALAAIQGLHELVKQKDAEIEALHARLTALEVVLQQVLGKP